MNAVLEAIKKRRSIRDFTKDPVEYEDLLQIVEAGIWAPSGKNNQPWRFVIITDKTVRDELAKLTIYKKVVDRSMAMIAVYLCKEDMYDEIKDIQAAGAAIQNMLLTVESLGLGAVWLGQILKNKEQVNEQLEISERYELMAVLAIGYPKLRNQKSTRKNISEFIIGKR